MVEETVKELTSTSIWIMDLWGSVEGCQLQQQRDEKWQIASVYICPLLNMNKSWSHTNWRLIQNASRGLLWNAGDQWSDSGPWSV